MTTKQRYDGVIAWFSEHMPVAESELHYTDPYQLLVAVILSAQCTDKRVNMTTPALFEAFPTPFDMAAATAEDIYPYIKSISYPNNKARNLAGMARSSAARCRAICSRCSACRAWAARRPTCWARCCGRRR